MPVSGVIARVYPPLREEVLSWCAERPEVTLSHETEEALVLVLETVDDQGARDLIEALERARGVIAVEVVYHNFEDMEIRQ